MANMFPDLGGAAVKESRLRANDKERELFLGRRHNRLLHYNRETEGITRGFFSSNLLKNCPVANIGLTKRIIDRVSEVYMVKPQYVFKGDETGEKQAEYLSVTKRKNERMQIAERRVNLLDVELIHPYYDEKAGSVDYDIIDEFEPMFDMDGNLVAVVYPLYQSANVNASDEQVFIYWDDEGNRARLDGNAHKVGEQPEPYEGMFPFVLAWTEEPGYFYDHNPSPDLINAEDGVNYLQTLLDAGQGFQAFGQMWIAGLLDPKDAATLGIDPSRLWALPEGATAGVISTTLNSQQVIDNIKNKYKMVARNYHLSEDFVEGNPQAESGVALKVRNEELNNERRGDIDRWAGVEALLYPIEKELIENETNIKLPESVFVDFNESVTILSDEERRERDDYNIEHNLDNWVSIKQRMNPDLDDKQAIEAIKSNMEINNEVAGQTAQNRLGAAFNAPVDG